MQAFATVRRRAVTVEEIKEEMECWKTIKARIAQQNECATESLDQQPRMQPKLVECATESRDPEPKTQSTLVDLLSAAVKVLSPEIGFSKQPTTEPTTLDNGKNDSFETQLEAESTKPDLSDSIDGAMESITLDDSPVVSADVVMKETDESNSDVGDSEVTTVKPPLTTALDSAEEVKEDETTITEAVISPANAEIEAKVTSTTEYLVQHPAPVSGSSAETVTSVTVPPAPSKPAAVPTDVTVTKAAGNQATGDAVLSAYRTAMESVQRKEEKKIESVNALLQAMLQGNNTSTVGNNQGLSHFLSALSNLQKLAFEQQAIVSAAETRALRQVEKVKKQKKSTPLLADDVPLGEQIPDQKRKAPKRRMTRDQLAKLNEIFAKRQKLEVPEREQLANELGVGVDQVTNWFIYKRRAFKEKQHHNEDVAMSDQAQPSPNLTSPSNNLKPGLNKLVDFQRSRTGSNDKRVITSFPAPTKPIPKKIPASEMHQKAGVSIKTSACFRPRSTAAVPLKAKHQTLSQTRRKAPSKTQFDFNAVQEAHQKRKQQPDLFSTIVRNMKELHSPDNA